MFEVGGFSVLSARRLREALIVVAHRPDQVTPASSSFAAFCANSIDQAIRPRVIFQSEVRLCEICRSNLPPQLHSQRD
jgi:hypothetical protein